MDSLEQPIIFAAAVILIAFRNFLLNKAIKCLNPTYVIARRNLFGRMPHFFGKSVKGLKIGFHRSQSVQDFKKHAVGVNRQIGKPARDISQSIAERQKQKRQFVPVKSPHLPERAAFIFASVKSVKSLSEVYALDF